MLPTKPTVRRDTISWLFFLVVSVYVQLWCPQYSSEIWDRLLACIGSKLNENVSKTILTFSLDQNCSFEIGLPSCCAWVCIASWSFGVHGLI